MASHYSAARLHSHFLHLHSESTSQTSVFPSIRDALVEILCVNCDLIEVIYNHLVLPQSRWGLIDGKLVRFHSRYDESAGRTPCDGWK